MSNQRLDEVLKLVKELLENEDAAFTDYISDGDLKLLADAARTAESAREQGFREAVEQSSGVLEEEAAEYFNQSKALSADERFVYLRIKTALLRIAARLRSLSPDEGMCESWLIFFEDAKVPDEVFTDGEVARQRFKALKDMWSCHLFREIHVKEGE